MVMVDVYTFELSVVVNTGSTTGSASPLAKPSQALSVNSLHLLMVSHGGKSPINVGRQVPMFVFTVARLFTSDLMRTVSSSVSREHIQVVSL
jgi:hypothetical protein